jgi:hypothetical protein
MVWVIAAIYPWESASPLGQADRSRPGRGWFPWPGLSFIAAPLMGPEFAPPVAPLEQPVTTTHRVISYTTRGSFLRAELTRPGKGDILCL